MQTHKEVPPAPDDFGHNWGRTVAEAISECKREYAVRCRIYDDWVAKGKLTDVDAADRIERLAAAVYYLRTVSDD